MGERGIRRHPYRRGRDGPVVRVKVKLVSGWIDWYRVRNGAEVGWQARKPPGFVDVPYFAAIYPFDPEHVGDDLLWCEGEKDTDCADKAGALAFTFGSAGSVPAVAVEYVEGRHLVILGDNDKAGRDFVQRAAALCDPVAASVRVYTFPDLAAGGDLADHLQAGGTIEQAIERAAVFEVSPEVESSTTSGGLVIRCAADIEPEPIEWLWLDRIAVGKQTIIAGEPGLGKSQLTAFMVAAVTTGGHWPNGEGRAPLGSAIILSAEDDPADTIVPRLIAAGADRSRVHIVSAVKRDDGTGRRMFNLQSDLVLLEAAMAQVGDVKLVIIDPISSYLGKADSHKNSDVRATLEPVGEMAARLRVAVVEVTHFSKGGGTSANGRVIGSIGFVAVARATFIVSPDPDDTSNSRRLFVPSKSNIGPPKDGLGFRVETRLIDGGIIAPAVNWDSLPVKRTADEILAAMAGGDRTSAKDDARIFLEDALSTGPVEVEVLEGAARAAGLLGVNQRISNCKPLRAAADALGVLKLRSGFGPGASYSWSLPDVPCAPSGTMRAHARPVSDEGAHGAHEGAHGDGGGP
jgi:AAA domain